MRTGIKRNDMKKNIRYKLKRHEGHWMAVILWSYANGGGGHTFEGTRWACIKFIISWWIKK